MLVYVCIGTTFSDNYSNLCESVYQSLLFCTDHIYVILSLCYIEEFNKKLQKMNVNGGVSNVHIINSDTLLIQEIDTYKKLLNNDTLSKDMINYRDSFWVNTTCRFFYIKKLYSMFPDKKMIYHIENDVMLYSSQESLMYIPEHVYMVKDSPKRVIGSIMCFCDYRSIELLCEHLISTFSIRFETDMYLLSSFKNIIKFPFNPYEVIEQSAIIYDGACLGQYLGGADYRNTVNKCHKYLNDSVGFINELTDFNPSNCIFYNDYTKSETNYLKIYKLISHNKTNIYKNKSFKINNLHIHSKVLCPFSSICDIKYTDIITGDRVLELCDIIITTVQIMQFHNIKSKKDLNLLLCDQSLNVDLNIVSGLKKVFIYTHILDEFLNKSIYSENEYHFYIHNSDHPFTDELFDKFMDKYPNCKIWTQNLGMTKNNQITNLLPIGLANAMWPHGNLITFYDTLCNVYTHKKPKDIYVNLSPTHPSRIKLIIEATGKGYKVNNGRVDYETYLNELSEHKFCLCSRGNGIDTHRFWESLYLGVIPVLINYETPNLFIDKLKELDILFVVYDTLPELETFNQELYDLLTEGYKLKYGKYPLCSNSLKISNFA